MKDCTCRSCLIKTCTEEKVFPVKETKGKLEKIWITEFPAVCKRGALLIPNALPAVVECFVRKREISVDGQDAKRCHRPVGCVKIPILEQSMKDSNLLHGQRLG